MQKSIQALLFSSLLIIISCTTENKTNPLMETVKDSTIFFPVTEYLNGQINEMETLPLTPLITITINDSTDSVWVTREDIRSFAQPFLNPVIDSASMSPYFSGKSFLDAGMDLFTLTYEPKQALPDSISILRWDVYISPVKKNIQRIYLVKEENKNEETLTTQLTWMAGKWCSIRTITKNQEGKALVKEEKMTWSL